MLTRRDPVKDYFGNYKKPHFEDNLFPERPEDIPSDKYCLATVEMDYKPYEGNYHYCYNVAGQGTNHHGKGRCAIHGGALTDKPEGLHNRYGDIASTRLQTLLSKFSADPDPLNLYPELGMARAINQMWQEDWQTINEALLAWFASFNPKRRGLHDQPLYHVSAIRHMLSKAIDTKDINRVLTLDDDELNEELNEAAEAWKIQWWQDGMSENGTPTRIPNLKVEKPVRLPDYSSGIKHLQLIDHIANRLMEHEKEAWLSSKDSLLLFSDLGSIMRVAVPRFLRQRNILLKENEVQPLLDDISQAFVLAIEKVDKSRYFRDYTSQALDKWLADQKEQMTYDLEFQNQPIDSNNGNTL